MTKRRAQALNGIARSVRPKKAEYEPDSRGYEAEYVGGHPGYLPARCRIFAEPEQLRIGGLGLSLPYKGIKDVGTITSKEVALSAVAALGPFGLIPQDHKYLALTIDDEGIDRQLVFTMKRSLFQTLDERVHDHPQLQAYVYHRMKAAKKEKAP